MEESKKRLRAKPIHKHELEADWLKSSYVPEEGEVVVYDAETDGNGTIVKPSRQKLGDGKTMVKDLPFADDVLREEVADEYVCKMKIQDVPSDHKRVYYLKGEVKTTTNPIELAGHVPLMVRAIGPDSVSPWSYINADGSPMDTPDDARAEGMLASPVVKRTTTSNKEVIYFEVDGSSDRAHDGHGYGKVTASKAVWEDVTLEVTAIVRDHNEGWEGDQTITTVIQAGQEESEELHFYIDWPSGEWSFYVSPRKIERNLGETYATTWNHVPGATSYQYITGTVKPYKTSGGKPICFADTYNRVYVEMSKDRGTYHRYVLTPNPEAPPNPDPDQFAQDVTLDSIPQRDKSGYIRVPSTKYGDPPSGDSKEYLRAMPKEYIDSAVDMLKENIHTLDENIGFVQNNIEALEHADDYINEKLDKMVPDYEGEPSGIDWSVEDYDLTPGHGMYATLYPDKAANTVEELENFMFHVDGNWDVIMVGEVDTTRIIRPNFVNHSAKGYWMASEEGLLLKGKSGHGELIGLLSVSTAGVKNIYEADLTVNATAAGRWCGRFVIYPDASAAGTSKFGEICRVGLDTSGTKFCLFAPTVTDNKMTIANAFAAFDPGETFNLRFEMQFGHNGTTYAAKIVVYVNGRKALVTELQTPVFNLCWYGLIVRTTSYASIADWRFNNIVNITTSSVTFGGMPKLAYAGRQAGYVQIPREPRSEKHPVSLGYLSTTLGKNYLHLGVSGGANQGPGILVGSKNLTNKRWVQCDLDVGGTTHVTGGYLCRPDFLQDYMTFASETYLLQTSNQRCYPITITNRNGYKVDFNCELVDVNEDSEFYILADYVYSSDPYMSKSLSQDVLVIGTNNQNYHSRSAIIGRDSINFGHASLIVGEDILNYGRVNLITGTSHLVEGSHNVVSGQFNNIRPADKWNTVQGFHLNTKGNHQTLFGLYNEPKENILLAVGNGTSDENRSNAFEVFEDGTVMISGEKVTVGSSSASIDRETIENLKTSFYMMAYEPDTSLFTTNNSSSLYISKPLPKKTIIPAAMNGKKCLYIDFITDPERRQGNFITFTSEVEEIHFPPGNISLSDPPCIWQEYDSDLGDMVQHNCYPNLRRLYLHGSISVGQSYHTVGWNWDSSPVVSVYIDDFKDWCESDFEEDQMCPLSSGGSLYVNGVLARDMTIPQGTKYIGYNAFCCGPSLANPIRIPSSVTRIGCYALSYFQKDIIFSEGLKDIENLALGENNLMSKVVLPSTIEYIAYDAFAGCYNLTEIHVPWGKDENKGNSAPWGAENATIYYNSKEPLQWM